MQVIRDFVGIMSIQTFIVIALSSVATYACLMFGLVVELPTALIGIAIVFPIVFSINAAYRRREEALRYFASLKAHAMGLFFAHKDWVPNDNQEHVERIKGLILKLLRTIRRTMTAEPPQPENFRDCYAVFSSFSDSMEQLRQAGVSGSEISRANQYLRSMIIDFENMRNIFLYRTPKALRAYSQVFLNAFPILFAPYFADLSDKYFFSLGFLLSAFYSLVLVSLDNIQERLENPYDEVGIDDVNLNVEADYQKILEAAAS